MLNTRCGSQKTIQSLQSVQVHGLMFIVELEASQSCFSFFGRRTKTANFAFAHNSYHDTTRIVTTDDGKSWILERKYHFLIKGWRWDFWNSNKLPFEYLMIMTNPHKRKSSQYHRLYLAEETKYQNAFERFKLFSFIVSSNCCPSWFSENVALNQSLSAPNHEMLKLNFLWCFCHWLHIHRRRKLNFCIKCFSFAKDVGKAQNLNSTVRMNV